MFGIPENVVLPVIGSTPVWALTGLTAVLFFTGMLRKYGIKKKKDVATLAAIATAFLLLGAPATVAPGVTPPVGITECESTVTPDVDPNSNNLFSPGTALTGDSAYRKVGISTWTSSAVGTELTGLEPFASYEYLAGTDAGTDHTAEDFCAPTTFTVKCQEDEVIEIDCVADEDASGLSSTFYNEDKSAAAQAITTSETKTVYVKFQSGSNEVYGDPWAPGAMGNVLVLHLNTTGYNTPDDVWVESGKDVISNANLAGTKLSAIGCPSIVTSAAGFSNFCYAAPAVSEDAMMIGAKLVAKAVDMTGDEVAYLLGGGRYINSLTNAPGYGVQDELGNAAGVGVAWENCTLNMS